MIQLRHFLATTSVLGIALGGISAAAAQVPVITQPPPVLERMSRGEAPPPPDPDPSHVQPYSQVEAQIGLENFADCLVRGWHDKVLSFVRTVPGSPSYAIAGHQLMVGECLRQQVRGSNGGGVQLKVEFDTLRKAAFGALFRREFGKAAPVDFAGLPPLDLSAEFDGAADRVDPRLLGYRVLGDCIARAAPTNARDLQFTRPGSPAESAEFGQIVPAMQGCLTTKQTVALNKYDLRGILAEAIYKLELSYAQAHPAADRGGRH
ncbi:MAG TPA: hypothetical protein VFW19_18560 [Allosphingosinicella sp.]|nr:hypothetical protein [Allosphingosinicella sp.]